MSSYPFRTALVTGASSGIGEVFARLLADAGVLTHVVARRTDRLEALAAQHDGITPLTADLTTTEGLSRVVELVDSGDVELVVNNAGFGTNGEFHELDPDRVAAEVDLNVGALTRLSRAALGTMVPAGRGWLLNVSSIASFQPAPRLAVYAASKAYVTSLTESLHEEAAPHGVHVTALCPGLTKTEFQRVSNTQRYADRFPSVAWTSPDEVARCGLDGVVSNRTLAVPGLQYKAMAAAAGVTPRWILRRASSMVQRG
jgi:short-subunit dehydrogenase